ncbi:hypothetical protein [Nitratiruptor tergarcus]|uniref:Metal ABC transporter ATP-binding protein n=1 Tax=Nitratiruptor tergarcus DSM 16512 TaxID=1069081 RepID=A0A1W1WSM4_9BACT|nr:hypothetical protein [Nitratiruptor tergarcus]SMC09205.1 hypothetical protein SAMN05660197_1010 [Nitratiruptor tergarcus DSM 16512]
MRKIVSLSLMLGVLFTGCAKKAEDINAAYVSPLQYRHYSCEQLQDEMARVSAKVSEIAGVQDKAHKRDVLATTVGLVVFWPALFFLASGDKAEELSRLKGEYEALQQSAIKKDCSFVASLKSRVDED